MARAYPHFIPGYVWHITHRCHRRDCLLKFAKDRTRWMELLFEAKKRYRLSAEIQIQHVTAAIQYRSLDRGKHNL